jgi:hypothetical protein
MSRDTVEAGGGHRTSLQDLMSTNNEQDEAVYRASGSVKENTMKQANEDFSRPDARHQPGVRRSARIRKSFRPWL